MSNKEAIAVGVDASGVVWDGHFGESPWYRIYDGNGELVEKRRNPHSVDAGGAGHHGNPKLIVDLLPECNVFVARAVGNPDKLAAFGVEAVLTTESDPDAAVRNRLRRGE